MRAGSLGLVPFLVLSQSQGDGLEGEKLYPYATMLAVVSMVFRRWVQAIARRRRVPRIALDPKIYIYRRNMLAKRVKASNCYSAEENILFFFSLHNLY